ncbi:MAG: hypothetical protein WBB27_00075 [Maribacter sp.]
MNANQTVLNDFVTKHPFAAAKALELLPNEDIANYFETLTLEKKALLFSFMETKRAAECVVLLSPNKTKELLEKAEVSLIASLLKTLETRQRNQLLNSISSERSAIISRQLEVLPNTVASIMEPATIVTKKIMVKDVLQLLKRADAKEELYLYVVDLEGVFKGIVRPKELLLADQDESMENLMLTSVRSFLKDIPVKSILEHPVWQEYYEIPILDSSGKILGKLPHRCLLKHINTPGKTSSNEIATTGSAIGELYRIGLTGLLQGGGN